MPILTFSQQVIWNVCCNHSKRKKNGETTNNSIKLHIIKILINSNDQTPVFHKELPDYRNKVYDSHLALNLKGLHFWKGLYTVMTITIQKRKKLCNPRIVTFIYQSPCICPKRNHLCSNDKLCLLNDVKQASSAKFAAAPVGMFCEE